MPPDIGTCRSAGSGARNLTAPPTPLRIPAHVLNGARAYLLGRQCANGGFSFYRSGHLEEPTLHDTWHALAALALLGESAPRREDIVRFVIGQTVQDQPYALYFRVRVLSLLRSTDPEHAPIVAAVAALKPAAPALNGAADPTDALDQLRLILWLKRHFAQAFAVEDITRGVLASEQPDGGFGVPPNLIATRHALSVLALCDAAPRAPTRDFVTHMATPGFGFRLTADSLAPNLETTCAGIACCARLRLPVLHADGALAFVLQCQTGNGGFARAPDALPDLALAHLALAGLDALAGPLHPRRRPP